LHCIAYRLGGAAKNRFAGRFLKREIADGVGSVEAYCGTLDHRIKSFNHFRRLKQFKRPR
jgi:hypothetical protein